MTSKVWYSTGSDFRHWIETDLDPTDEQFLEDIAQECAADFHSEHDGWEASWPRDFVLYLDDEDSPAIATLEVGRDVEPVFTASLLHAEPTTK